MPSISSPTLLNNMPFRNFAPKKSKPADLISISSEKTIVEPVPDPSQQEYLRRIMEEQKRTQPQLFVYGHPAIGSRDMETDALQAEQLKYVEPLNPTDAS
ncbi:hypothetical protein BJ742DRAFT_775737 [Cladochytrium replicatum]|nr:hypothetical protein BJ742DRAFT_775737 [Cladochytrium replicatum]